MVCLDRMAHPDNFERGICEASSALSIGKWYESWFPVDVGAHLISFGVFLAEVEEYTVDVFMRAFDGHDATEVFYVSTHTVRLGEPHSLYFEITPNFPWLEGITLTPIEEIEERKLEVLELSTNDPNTLSEIRSLSQIGENIYSTLSGLGGLLSNIGSLGSMLVSGFFNSLMGNLSGLFQRSAEESIKTSLSAIDDVVGESPEWKTKVDEKISAYAGDLVNKTLSELSPGAIGDSPLSPERASQMLTVAGVAGLGIHTTAFIGGIVAEAATLGQLDGFSRISAEVLDKLGLGELSRAMVMTPLEPLLLTPARQYWNSQFTPVIPDSADLIQMVVREVIDIPTFKELMAYQGFSEVHSQRIWDAHFIAPSQGALLTSFRRGNISREELIAYQILVDLDERYNPIWEDQWYRDPTPRQARFMYEAGAIDLTRLRDSVVRSGMVPEFVDPFTDYLARFQERIWQRRYLVALASGYRAGVYDASRIESEVEAAGYSAGVSKWMIAAEDVQKEIAAAKVPPEKFSLISVSYATDAFINADVDEEWLREYFDRKGYVIEDIDIAIGVLNRKRDKATAAAGGE